VNRIRAPAPECASASTFTLALTFLHGVVARRTFPAREHDRAFTFYQERPFRRRSLRGYRERECTLAAHGASEISANEAACAGLSGKLVTSNGWNGWWSAD